MEDTEWNDVLRARGIIPQKEVEITEEELNELADEAVARFNSKEYKLERATLDELDELEDEEDDRVLEMYRQRRLQEMKNVAARRLFGELRQISEPDFVREVSDASKQNWVVCHLFKDSIPACKLVNALLTRIAAQYRETKFVKIVGDHCIHGYPDRNMPTLVIYHGGDMKRQIVGIQSFPGGMSCTLADMERLLISIGAITKAAKDEDVDDEDDGKGPGRVINFASKRSQSDDSDDSDWD
ncbi:thioredoxin-like protein [Catenaria anguillulae PL171]|uniref:Thioredoxin-like protein n=1 Tax=Catenaria anguillulae PL171 TaxID=765915 RepID=A0A1Y2HRU3_9FUNG|nr:thioredoxin-like protein [Catenaria anguillulae PL171]